MDTVSADLIQNIYGEGTIYGRQRGLIMDIIGTVNIELWAVVLGATEALLNLEMPYGYELRHLKLRDTPVYEEVVNARGNLDIKYMASNLSDEVAPEFIFLCKTENKAMPLEYFTIGEMMSGNEKAGKYFNEITDKWNKEIFRILSILRLTQEGNIEIADKIYKMRATYKCNNIERRRVSSQDSPISVYDDLYEWNNDNLTCFKDMVELSEDLLVLVENVMERFGRGYSSSRYDDAYKNLITLSEIILIGYNSNDKGAAIKEKFANRLATAIAQDVDVQTVHDKALRMYKERSNETHEGNNLNITKEELRELRCAVRKMVQNFIFFAKNQYGSIVDKTFKGIKREYVIGLLVRIHILQTRGLLR